MKPDNGVSADIETGASSQQPSDSREAPPNRPQCAAEIMEDVFTLMAYANKAGIQLPDALRAEIADLVNEQYIDEETE